MSKLYFDLDGVLADYDTAANEVLGTENHYKFDFVHGPEEYWRLIHLRAPNFFLSFDMMPDAWSLWAATKHLKPTILTALPKTNSFNVDVQKRKWVALQFGLEVKVITCLTKDKPNYCQPGDILVDDRSVNKAAWEKAGGQFVLHEYAWQTIDALTEMGVLN